MSTCFSSRPVALMQLGSGVLKLHPLPEVSHMWERYPFMIFPANGKPIETAGEEAPGTPGRHTAVPICTPPRDLQVLAQPNGNGRPKRSPQNLGKALRSLTMRRRRPLSQGAEVVPIM